MTTWKRALLKAAEHVAAAIAETKESRPGWMPICIAYRRVEAAQAELQKVIAELDQTQAVQNWRASGLRITLNPEAKP